MKMEETNVHLIEECRRGNRTAQLALYKQFVQRLYVACLRIVGNVPEAEEAMQDSFLKIFTRLDQYRVILLVYVYVVLVLSTIVIRSTL